MPLSPVGALRPTLADAAYQSIVDAVMAGEIGPGHRLIMDQLAEQLEISRTPVRDALHRLEREGLIEPTGRRGFVVRVINDDEVAQIYTAREAIEGYAARLLIEVGATKREANDAGDATVADRFDRAVQTAALAQDGTSAGAFEANRLVHRSVVQLAGNRFLLTSFDDLWGLGLAIFAFIQRFPVDPIADDVQADHAALSSAFRSGEGDLAQRTMIEHIREGFDRFRATG